MKYHGIRSESLSRSNRRTLLFVTSALSAVAFAGTPGEAGTVTVAAPVAPATSTEVAPINADIVAKISAPADANLKVDVQAGAVVLGGGSIFLSPPATGQGDGKIEFNNLGKIGSVDLLGSVTDFTGVSLNGSPSVATNTATVVNSGLITRGLTVQNFGGAVSISNSGTVHNGLVGTGRGNVSVTTASTGAVRSGVVAAVAQGTTTSAPPVDGITTSKTTSGNATVVQDGPAANADATARSQIFAISQAGNAEALVSNTAGNVQSIAGGAFNTVNGGSAASPSKTVTTSRSDSTALGGTSKVTIAATGDVNNVQSSGVGGSTVVIDGKVTGSTASSSSGADTTFANTVTQNAGGFQTETTSASSSTPVGKSASTAIGATGSVSGSVNTAVNGSGNASATVDGAVDGSVNTSSQGTATTNSSKQTFDGTAANIQLSSQSKNTAAAVGGTATNTVGKTGVVKGSVSATGDAGAAATNSGRITGNVNATSARFVNASNASDASFATTGTTSNSSFKSGQVGGTASVSNEAGGLIEGSVNANGLAGVTISNKGVVRGTTSGTSTGQATTNDFGDVDTATTVVGVAPALDVTTTTSKSTQTFTDAAVGGSVTGTYAGANGFDNFASGNGSVTQTANKASTVTVSGSVFGNVSSTAGTGNNQQFSFAGETGSVLDTDTTGTTSGKSTTSNKVQSTAGGASTVRVSGVVATGNSGSAASVSSNGTDSSSVVIDSGRVEGNVSSNASGASSFVSTDVETYAQAATKGVFATSSASDIRSATSVVSGGASLIDLQGTAKVLGSVNVAGVESAAVKVASGAAVGTSTTTANLIVSAAGTDGSSGSENTYARNATTRDTTVTSKFTSSSGAAAASGNASADVAGTVFGTASVNAARGNATASVSGTVRDSVNVNSLDNGTVFTSSSQNDYAGKVNGGASTSVFGNPTPALVKVTSSNTSAATGGQASITVDTNATLQGLGLGGVGGSASARGLAGAAVTVTTGSKIGGSASATSLRNNSTGNTVQTIGATSTDQTSDSTSKAVGGAAVITNAGSIANSATATGRTAASVSNTGRIGFSGGSVSATALGTDTVFNTVDTNINNPALRNQVSKTTFTAVGGEAKVTNAAGALINGAVSVAGVTGSVNNNGAINGAITVGTAVFDYTETTTRTATTTTVAVTQPAKLFSQTYTVDQSGTSRGISVQGATVPYANPDNLSAPPVLKTSDVAATINLNSGSATLGSIDAQRSATGDYLTNTTVNLNGAGFLGSDRTFTTAPTSSDRSPVLVLSKDAVDAGFGTGSVAVSVRGVTALNKTGSGTFVINGTSYVAPTASALQPSWTLEVGSFNVNAGEVQLWVAPTTPPSQFGIKGNVVNNATIVVGRRSPTATQLVGDSLVSSGTETIAGITVRQMGNFTQGAAGTTVVGINPSLVRFGNLGIQPSSGANEVLGPISAGVNVPFFTTPVLGGVASTPSRWNITGDLNLAGKVVTDINRNSIFSSDDGYVLFSYTGTGAVTATVDTSLKSKFVTIGLKHDTTAKTVSLAATRTSYATGATNPNAINAAVALDSAIPDIVSRIKSDASGGAAFTSVSSIGRAQDIANIVSGLDWRLDSAQAAQVFNELSSAEIYGSLASVKQNLAFGESVNMLTARRSVGQDFGTRLWVNPVGSFGKYGGTSSGASKIKVNSYGGALGLDVGYQDDGAFGVGFGYTQHDVNARGTEETARAKTYTIGAYWTQGFGPIYANAQFAYGFSEFDTQRDLSILARSIGASFKGNEWDGSLEVGYDWKTSGALVVTPFGQLAARHWSMKGFTETGGAGIGLKVNGASKTVFNPTLGVKLAAQMGELDGFAFRPYAKAAYTFQGSLGNARTVQYLGGGNAFSLTGVDPDSFGTFEAGVDASINNKVGLFISGGFGFGGQQKTSKIQGGIEIRF